MQLNEWAVEALFVGERPLKTMEITADENEEQVSVRVYKWMRITLTKNLNKAIGFVNGMGAEVLGVDNGNLVVRTDQGRLILVHPWTSESRVAHVPFRVGYASTLHKVQGATLAHITLWLDIANMPAAAYVALSRVQRDEDWRIVGKVTVHHFTPARF